MDEYLAAKYLGGAKGDALRARQSSKKKRKHADQPSGSGFSIVDTGSDWGAVKAEDDDTPMVVESRQKAGFKPVKKQRTPSPDTLKPEPEDEQPTVVGDDAAPKRPMGGLQSAAELAESTRKAKEKEARQRERALKAMEESTGAGETVYRDASGKARDTKSEKAEARRQREREIQKEQERMEWGKGLVQREDKRKRQEELEQAAAAPMARYANDDTLNQSQKEVMRWNDPMANMLSKPSGSGNNRKKERPMYRGPPPPPNRFGIKPGYRWDGVDRSTGFERKYLQRGNAVKVRNAEAYAYGTEDM